MVKLRVRQRRVDQEHLDRIARHHEAMTALARVARPPDIEGHREQRAA
jgi:hypothetical protein